jgi:low temperature requirement protein LtrA
MNSNVQSRIILLLAISIIFLLIAQYVVNEDPWQRIFRLLALIVLAGGELYLLFDYHRNKAMR